MGVAQVVVSILNWSAICRVNNDRQQAQSKLMGIVLNQDAGVRQLDVCILPQFTYHRGQLFLAEHMCLKNLSSASLNVDKTMILPYASRLDQRDSRPLVYHGRIVTSLGLKEKEWAFKNAALVRNQRTEPADQVAAANMLVVEDIQPDALPSSTTAEGLVQGARKFEQIGASGYRRILEAALDGVTIPSKGGIIVVDNSLSVGDSFDAVVETAIGILDPPKAHVSSRSIGGLQRSDQEVLSAQWSSSSLGGCCT